ncbi:MAG: tetratricopeptide repeat protein [Oceanococcus sp.]
MSLLCAFGSPVHAAAGPEQAFANGINAFRSNHLQQANSYFLEAYQAGLKTPRLFYNMGVVSYRLGNYQQALEYFQQAAAFPATRQIAHYNLARSAQAQKNVVQARNWYQQAREGKDPRISDLARRAQATLDEASLLDWQFSGQLFTGYDSAVVGLTDLVTTVPTASADLFQELQLTASYGDIPVSDGSLSVQLNAYQLAYETVDEADIQSVASGLRWRSHSQRSRLAWRINIAHDWLSSAPYQLRAGLGGSWEQAWHSLWMTTAFNGAWYEPQSPGLEGIAGARYDLSLTGLGRSMGGFGFVQLFGQLNPRRDELNSPRRHGVRAYWRSSSVSVWSLHPSIQWRVSSYQDSVLPKERRLRARLRLISRLSADWESLIDAEYERNRSVLEAREYEHVRLMLGLRWSPL